jgi:NhaP-type Na+/H+ and K+/H+ antiporter
MSFKQVIICSYAGLRGAVGLSLALIVAATPSVPKYVQDVILLHVGGVALLTLLINATTTGWLVNQLGLSKESDLKKNILVGLTYKLERIIDENIETLKTKRHFNHIEWVQLRDSVKLNELKKRLRRYRNLEFNISKEKYEDHLDPKHLN